jgi:hypothetical protein
VTAYDVPAESACCLHRFLEINARSCFELAKTCAIHRLVGDVGGKLMLIKLDNRKAATVNGNAIA